MFTGTTENYVLIPNPAKPGFATFYELASESAYTTNSFVLLPYKNPQVQKPSQKFFRIKNKTEVQLPKTIGDRAAIQLRARTSKEDYIRNVTKLKEQIQRGNIYEMNYCIEFYAEDVLVDPMQVFVKLDDLAKAPYTMLFKAGDEFIICASPELFLKRTGQSISSKPIKGTTRRGKNKSEDEQLKNELYNSHKERTENVMAVDVARNDLSHFAKRGSVQVNKLYNIETFETVHQMVSTISCEIKEGTGFETILDSTFPMASMTGAPKLRAMSLIDEFEDFERGNYSGAMGIIEENGDFTLSVIIRSIFYDQTSRRLSLAVGGAITYLSEPEKEYEECLLKASALMKALGARVS